MPKNFTEDIEDSSDEKNSEEISDKENSDEENSSEKNYHDKLNVTMSFFWEKIFMSS